jgi:hypothetical protein
MCGAQTHNNRERHAKKWYDYRPTKTGRIISYLTLYGLFVIADAYEFFDRHHYFSIFAGLVATVALFYEAFYDEIINSRVFTFLSVLAVLFSAFLTVWVGPTPPLPPTIGWLQPGNEPTPPNSCDKYFASQPSDTNTALILIGGMALFKTNTFGSIPKKQIVLRVGGCSLLSLQTSANGATIDASIYDDKGNQLGNIDNNKLTILSDKGLTIERSGDLSAIIVHDDRGRELIYVRYLNKTTFKIRGIFTCPTPTLRTVSFNDSPVFDTNEFHGCSGDNGGADLSIDPERN